MRFSLFLLIVLCGAYAMINLSSPRVDAEQVSSFPAEVFPRLVDHELTRYTDPQEFRPTDSITRGEAAKFVSQYAPLVELEQWEGACAFSDAAWYDATLQPYLTTSCQYGFFKWTAGKFLPEASLTEAQALAVVMRSLRWYQDETVQPWYKNYYELASEHGLLTNETLTSVEITPVTREKLATRLFAVFTIYEEDGGWLDAYEYDGERDDDADGQWDEDEGIVYETEVESEEECSSLEEYDPETKTCFFSCADEAECEAILAEIDAEFATWTEPFEDDERVLHEDEDTASETYLFHALYTVQTGEKIVLAKGVDSSEFQKIWQEIAELSPNALSNSYIQSFEIYSDPESDVSAAVVDGDGNWKREVSLNLTHHTSSDLKEQKAVLIHELSHILTLNKDQIIANYTTCATYETAEWCTVASSYLHNFVQKFWKDKVNPEYTEDAFVTEYATTNPEEDIAESFAYFVLESNHNDTTVRNQKVNFFNRYPELVKMRAEMRSELAKYVLRLKRAQ